MGKQQKSRQLTTMIFVFLLCLISAALLALVSSFLNKRQNQAKARYLTRQLLISARIIDHKGYFLLQNQPANFENGHLVLTNAPSKATSEQIQQIYENRFIPMLCDEAGNQLTFESIGLTYSEYLDQNKNADLSSLKYKLFYKISSQNDPKKMYGYTFPIYAFGLWDSIYALISIEANCTTVIGFSCYEQKETPGLGGEISEPWWQNQFHDKLIFQENQQGKIDFTSAPLGINVVKPGKMETLPKVKQRSSVDGITGASITSEGMMVGIKNSLQPYRNLLIKLRESYEKTSH